MKKLFVTLTLILTLCSANLSHAADRYVMLKIDATTTSASHSVGSGEVAFLLWTSYVCQVGASDAKLQVTYGGVTKQVNPERLGSSSFGHIYIVDKIVVPGPATITYSTNNNSANLLSLKVSPNPNITFSRGGDVANSP